MKSFLTFLSYWENGTKGDDDNTIVEGSTLWLPDMHGGAWSVVQCPTKEKSRNVHLQNMYSGTY